MWPGRQQTQRPVGWRTETGWGYRARRGPVPGVLEPGWAPSCPHTHHPPHPPGGEVLGQGRAERAGARAGRLPVPSLDSEGKGSQLLPWLRCVEASSLEETQQPQHPSGGHRARASPAPPSAAVRSWTGSLASVSCKMGQLHPRGHAESSTRSGPDQHRQERSAAGGGTVAPQPPRVGAARLLEQQASENRPVPTAGGGDRGAAGEP